MSTELADLPLFGPAMTDAREADRLRGKMGQVFELMQDGRWRTSDGATTECIRRFGGHFKESSVARYIRLFHNPGVVGWRREERALGHGIYEFRLVRR